MTAAERLLSELRNAVGTDVFALKGNEIFVCVAKDTFFLRLADGDAFVVCVDLQHIACVDVEMAADVLGNDNSACLVDFPEIRINHHIRLRFDILRYYFTILMVVCQLSANIL